MFKMKVPRAAIHQFFRPQFLLGFFIGICFFSLGMQMVIICLRLSDIDTSLLDGNLAQNKREIPDVPDPPMGYEVHNLGLKLHSAGNDVNFFEGDSHVIKYYTGHEASPVDHFDIVSESQVQLDDKARKEVSAKRLAYVGVMTDHKRLSEQAAVIRMTWASELPVVQFFFDMMERDEDQSRRTKREHVREVIGLPGVSKDETYGVKHVFETLKHVCHDHANEYHWYILVRDATYLHTSGLIRVLDRLSPSEGIIIGLTESAQDNVCKTSSGLVLSHHTLTDICARLHACSDLETKDDGHKALSQCLGLRCISSLKISPDFHLSINRDREVNKLLDNAENTGELLDNTVFIGQLPSVQDLYKLHLHFTRRKIIKTQDEIYRLGEELSRTRRSVRPKRDKSVLKFRETAVFGADALLNKTNDQLHQFIDNEGNLYLDTCKVRKHDVGRVDTSPYRTALELAKREIGSISDSFESFAYKVVKPNIGIEYQFYFIQTLTYSPSIGRRVKPPKEKVYQVTVLHPYGKLEMVSKEIQPLKTINFVVSTSASIESINEFLLNYESVCLKIANSTLPRCKLFIILFSKTMNSKIYLKVDDIERRLKSLHEKYTGMVTQIMEVKGESVTIARTVQMADSAFDSGDLLAFLPVDALFNEDFLFRCQLNTFLQKRAYFPVAFQRYDRAISVPVEVSIKAEDGYWANSDFSSFCAYKDDLQMFDNLPGSSRDLHNMFKASEVVGVFRAPDPGLHFNWKKHVCSIGNLLERSECMKEFKYMNMQ